MTGLFRALVYAALCWLFSKKMFMDFLQWEFCEGIVREAGHTWTVADRDEMKSWLVSFPTY